MFGPLVILAVDAFVKWPFIEDLDIVLEVH